MWDALSCNKYLDGSILREFSKELNWNLLSKHYVFSLELLESFCDLVNWHVYSSRPNTYIENRYLDRYGLDMNWTELLRRQSVPNDILMKYREVMDWDELFKNHQVDEMIIRHNLEYVNWDILSYSQRGLSPEFIHEHRDELNWYHISYNYTFDMPFVFEHIDRIKKEILKDKYGIKVHKGLRTLFKVKYTHEDTPIKKENKRRNSIE